MRQASLIFISAAALCFSAFEAAAIIDVNLQMQLGNPTGATADTNNHNNYLIQRTIEAIDYNDNKGQPNWTSWNLTASDVGSSGRTDAWSVDTSLPESFYKVPINTFGSVNGQSYDRGHMCPSADRTDTVPNNEKTFIMSNIIPQASQQNQHVWASLEAYSRSLLGAQELLIMCGPSNFGTNTIAAGHVFIPSNTWKVIVCTPLGAGTAFDRITNANPASIRVIAVKIPNTDAAGNQPWTDFVTSTRQLQADLGYNFFSALPNNLAWVLRSKVDGQTPTAPAITGFSPISGPVDSSVTINGSRLDTVTNVTFNGTLASYTITATNQITATVPASASSGPITVKGLGGSATSAASFTVTPAVAPDFTVTPAGAFVSSGEQGGPFSPSNQVYTLNNTNATALSWGVSKYSSWLSLSATSGALAGGSSTDITASVNIAANSLVGGSYFDSITFSNAVTGAAVTRTVNLSVLTSGQLSVSPASTLNAAGTLGGPFSPSSQNYTLSNTGSATLNWTANATAPWLSLSSVSGTLVGGGSTVVTVSINNSANSLSPGVYSDVIGFTNTTNGAGNTTRSANLTVNAPNPAQLNVSPATGLTSTGPVGGPFNPSFQSYTLSNNGSVTLNWTANATAPWLNVSSVSGTLVGGASTVVTVSINNNANSLSQGSYSDVVGFTNMTNGAGNTTRAASLTVNTLSPAQLNVSPASGLAAGGFVGGPFTPSNQLYTLSNAGSVTLNWTAGASTNWVTLSTTNGTLAGGASTNITVAFNSNANNLASGSYSNTLSFTNLSNGNGSTTRIVALTVATPGGLVVLSSAPVCTTLPGSSFGGVTFGNVTAGQVYEYLASGCVRYNYDGGYSDPDGITYINNCNSFVGNPVAAPSGFRCPGLSSVSLVGKVNGTCIQLGKNGSFVAPSTGTLTLYYNDNIFYDNNSSWNVCIFVPSDFASTGPVGGPFNPASQVYTLSNSSPSVISWSGMSGASWLTFSPASGTLAAGGTASVVVSINGNASLLPAASYSDNVIFAISGVASWVRPASLNVFSGSFFDDVENGTNGWTASGLWHINGNTSCTSYSSPTHSWYYGTNSTCTYDTGVANSGDLISPSFLVPNAGTLTFQSWEETESASTTWDKRIVYITTNNAASWVQLLQSTDNSAAWRTVSIDLAAYAGKTAKLRFNFNTIDSGGNDFRGWYLDDILVSGLGGGLNVTPSTTLTATGPQGGPFGPSNQVYLLSNSGSGSVSWAASVSNNWLTLSLTSGMLASGATTNLTVTFNPNADNLAIGMHSDSITITNLTATNALTRAVNLTVVAPAALAVSPAGGLTSSGFTGGPFSPPSQTYSLTNTGDVALNWTVSKTASWLSLSAASGALAAGGNTNITVTLNANSLTAGSYSDTVGFANLTTGIGNTTRPVNLTVNPIPALIVANGATLTAEGCAPGNGVADPDETVTFNFGLRNTGGTDTTNLVATLLATNGVTAPSSPQMYGAVVAGGGTVAQSFTLTATGSCAGMVTATLQLQDGASNLGTITYAIPLGQFTPVFTQNFDAVSAPALPAGWATTSTGAQSNWVTSTNSVDTAPNAAFSPDPGNIGLNELVTPPIAINTSGAQLTFRQKYGLAINPTNSATGYDGGVLEIKIGNGSYTDIVAAGGSFVSGGYNAVLSSSYSNPLAGRAAWSGTSGGFATTVVNLPASAAGQNVQLRWRCGAGTAPPPVSSSGTLAYWNFDASTPTANTIAPNLSVSPVTNLNSGALTYPNGTPTSNKAISSSGFTTLSGPPNGTYSYYTFSLAAANGFQVGLSSLGFLDRASATGPTNFTVQISQDATFATTIFDSLTQIAHVSATVVLGTNTFALSNSGLAGTIYVRIYGYKATSSAGTWRLDDLTVQGSVSSTSTGGGNGWYIDSVSINDTLCCATVVNPPVASFTRTPTTGTEPLVVNFTDTSTGIISGRFWDFGDTVTTNLTTNAMVHVYAAGSYDVMLVVTGPDGVSTNLQIACVSVLTPFQAWQVQYFGNTNNPSANADADPDGDGMSNLKELLTGTDPTNSASFFGIISIVPEDDGLRVTWPTTTGRTNALQSSSYITSNYADIFIATNTVPGTTNYFDSGATTNIPGHFYRLRLVP